jgi:hypothetical protein
MRPIQWRPGWMPSRRSSRTRAPTEMPSEGGVGHRADVALGDRDDLARDGAGGGVDRDAVADPRLVRQSGELQRGLADCHDAADAPIARDAIELGFEGGEGGRHVALRNHRVRLRFLNGGG